VKNKKEKSDIPPDSEKRGKGAPCTKRVPGTMGERIYLHRRHLKLSITEFAKIVGISLGSLCQIEKNKRKPNLRTIEKISRATGISVSYLISG